MKAEKEHIAQQLLQNGFTQTQRSIHGGMNAKFDKLFALFWYARFLPPPRLYAYQAAATFLYLVSFHVPTVLYFQAQVCKQATLS